MPFAERYPFALLFAHVDIPQSSLASPTFAKPWAAGAGAILDDDGDRCYFVSA
jgi:hypothetical protein